MTPDERRRRARSDMLLALVYITVAAALVGATVAVVL